MEECKAVSRLTLSSSRHPEELDEDEMDEEEDTTGPGPAPAMPGIPEQFRSSGQ